MSIENSEELKKLETKMAYIPSPEEKIDIEYALGFKKAAYEQTKLERAEWRRSYERYKLTRKLSEYDYVEDVPLGLTYDSVERAAAALPGKEFGFQAKPTGDEDMKDAIMASQYFKQIWENPDAMDGPAKMDVVKKGAALFGTVFAQVYWETSFDSDGNLKKSDPCFNPLNIFDCYYNKFYSEIDDLPEFGYETFVSLEWIKNNAKQLGYQNTDTVKGTVLRRGSAYDEDSSYIDMKETPSMQGDSDKLRIVRLFEIQTPDWIYTFALDDNSAIFLRKIKNKIGKIAIVAFRWKRNPLPNRLLGVTDIASGGEIEDAIQRASNQAIFNSLLVDNPMFTFDKTDRDIDPRTFIGAPAAAIPRGKDPNSITPLSIPSHLNDSLAMINTLLQRYKRTVNVPDSIAGQGDANADTATEVSIIDANAKATYAKVIDSFKYTMLKLALLVRDLFEQYGPESITLQISEPELLERLKENQFEQMPETGMSATATKESFVLKRDIEITVDFTTQNKAVLSRNLVSFMGLTAKDQTIPPQVKMKMYKTFLELNDLEKIALALDEAINQDSKMNPSDLSTADKENNEMAQGQAIPSTPNASPAHTQRHIEFIRQNQFGPQTDRIFQQHIQGELDGLQGKAQQTMGGQEEEAMPSQESTDMSSMTSNANEVAV